MDTGPAWFQQVYHDIYEKGVVNHVAHLERDPTIPYNIGTLVSLYNTVFKLGSGDKSAFGGVDAGEDFSQSPSNLLLEALSDNISSVLTETHLPRLEEAMTQDDVTFLNVWNQRWHNFRTFASGIRIIFFYLDTNFIRNAPTVLERCYDQFFTHIFVPFRERLYKAIRAQVCDHRAGCAIDTVAVRLAVQSTVLLGQELREYKRSAEDSLSLYRGLSVLLLEDVRVHYEQVIPQWASQLDYGAYVSAVKQVFDTELEERVNAYLHSDSYEPVKRQLHDIALKKQLDSLLARPGAMDYFFAPQHGDKLALLYFLSSTDSSSVDIIAARLKAHLSAVGSSLVDTHAAKVAGGTTPATPTADASTTTTTTTTTSADNTTSGNAPSSAALIESLVELNNSYELTIMQHCGSNASLRRALNEAFQSFINRDRHVSVQLAQYAHALMCVRGEQGVVDNSRSRQSALASLFEYIREKDVFQRIYRELLAQRLLEGNTRGQQEEGVLAEELNQRQATSEWLESVKTMLSDVDESHVFTESVRTQREAVLQQHGLQLELTVCTDQLWPSTTTTVTKMEGLPDMLQQVVHDATNIYKHGSQRGYAQRQLTWHLDKGSADVRMQFANGTSKILTVTTLMMMILSLLDDIPNKAKFTTWEALLARMGYKTTDKEARVVMQHALGLADPKFAIIQKSNAKDMTTIADTEKLMLAKQCNPVHARSQRVFIPVKELVTAEDVARRDVEINKGRQVSLEAAIVRIMKARKTMHHTDLQREVMSQMSQFHPDTATYKLALESMLTQEFIARDEHDRNIMQYMA